MNNNISIVWDFDGTLSPKDSTTMVIEALEGGTGGKEFWKFVKYLRGDLTSNDWEHVLAADAPIWMWALSRIAYLNRIPLTKTYFQTIHSKIELYPGVKEFLKGIKKLSDREEFKRTKTRIFHFVVSAGLSELIRLVFTEELVKHVWGCRYQAIMEDGSDAPESVPVFCMDETMKTRALFEISKGSFEKPHECHVNKRVSEENRFCSFKDMIYVGDGFSDVPALSLVRSQGGMGIIVFDSSLSRPDRSVKINPLKQDRRADLITEADFSRSGELFKTVKAKCLQIQQKHAACTAF